MNLFDWIIPKRSRMRRLFGDYVSTTSRRTPTISRVICFADPEWGFSDQSLPKLKAFLVDLGDVDVSVTNSHLFIRYIGEEAKGKYEVDLARLTRLREDEVFRDFRIGTAEGLQSSFVDIGLLQNAAARQITQK